MRTGVIAKKMGMTRLFAEDGRHVPVTVLALEGCQVVSQRTIETDGYVAVQLGAGVAKAKNVTKPMRGHYGVAEGGAQGDAGRVPRVRGCAGRRGRVAFGRALCRGPGSRRDRPDAGQGLSGRDQALGLRRFARDARCVGVHRSHGSTGQRQDPGKVFKNKKMAGHMGDRQRTQQNLTVVGTDAARGLIFLRDRCRVRRAAGCWCAMR